MKIQSVLQSNFAVTLLKPFVPPGVRRGVRRLMRWLRGEGGDLGVHWGRIVYIQHWARFLSTLPTERLSLLEVSPGPVSMWREHGWASYSSVQFPDFDIMNDRLSESFDVIIAEQVFEHLRHPYSAAKNIHAMLKADGVFIIATPFMVRVHNEPGDYTRWTELGMAAFLEDSGFVAETYSWGNDKCIVANFHEWKPLRKGHDLTNQPHLPFVVWAYARKRS